MPIGLPRVLVEPARTFATACKVLCANCRNIYLEWNVVEVLFVEFHVVAARAGAGAATLLTAAWGSALTVAVAGAAEELDIVGDHVHLAPLRAVLGLPGTVLKASFYQDRVALLLVVGDGLAQLAPGGDVEKVDLLGLGAPAVHGQTERAHRDAAVREPEFGIPRHVPRQNDPVEADHVRTLSFKSLLIPVYKTAAASQEVNAPLSDSNARGDESAMNRSQATVNPRSRHRTGSTRALGSAV